MFTLKDVRRTRDAGRIVAVGSEGLVFEPVDPKPLCLMKERLCAITEIKPGQHFADAERAGDNLAERKRKHLHRLSNILLSHSDGRLQFVHPSGFTEEVRIRLPRLFQAVTLPGRSLSFVEGSTFTSHPVSEGKLLHSSAMQQLGLMADFFGSNFRKGLDGKVIVLEVFGGIHPEVFKYCERLCPESRKAAVEELAKLYLLGGCERYPTTEPMYDGSLHKYWQKKEAAFIEFSADTSNSELMARLNKAFAASNQPYRYSINSMFANGNGYDTSRAYKLFGEMFYPTAFDWENGNKNEIYGIAPAIFSDFLNARKRLTEAFAKIRAYAEEISGKTPEMLVDPASTQDAFKEAYDCERNQDALKRLLGQTTI